MAIKNEAQFEFKLEPPKVREVKLMAADDIYKSLERLSLVDIKETHKVERKPVGIHAKALGEYFSIFANSPPDGGIVLIGVEDDGTVSGCRRAAPEHVNNLERAGDIYCPDARYETRQVRTLKQVRTLNKNNESDFILAIRIRYRPDKVVETTDRSAWIRRGSSKKKLDDDEKWELKDAKGQVEVELERASLAFPDEFRQSYTLRSHPLDVDDGAAQ